MPLPISASSSAACAWPTGLSASSCPALLSAPKNSEISQLAACLATSAGWLALRRGGFEQQRLEPARGLDFGGQHRGVVGRQPELLDVAPALGVGQLGQAGAAFVEERVVELERQQVGIGEVAVVVRVFLAAHRARGAGAGIEQPGFLHDRAAVLDQLDLAARLVLDRLHHEAHRVDVLGLGPRAQLVAGLAHADVDVGAHRAFLHVAVAAADIAQDRAQLADIGPGLGRRAHVGPADDLHQRHARAVEVDVGHASGAGRASACPRPARRGCARCRCTLSSGIPAFSSASIVSAPSPTSGW